MLGLEGENRLPGRGVYCIIAAKYTPNHQVRGVGPVLPRRIERCSVNLGQGGRSVDRILGLGRCFFAISIVGFGVQYLVYGHYLGGLPPVPPWAPGGAVGAYSVGAVLVALGLSIFFNWKARFSAAVLGLLFLLCVVLLHTWRISSVINDGNDRTRALEPLALAGAAFMLAATLAADWPEARRWNAAVGWLSELGRWIFAGSMVIFGVQHFMYAGFLATLVTAWIPLHLFWIYLTGVGMIVAGLCIAIKKFGGLAATWLGIMFLLWVIVLHGPRVAAHPRNADEWSSLLVALGMGGASWIVARSLYKES